jgi:hypothetical protein
VSVTQCWQLVARTLRHLATRRVMPSAIGPQVLECSRLPWKQRPSLFCAPGKWGRKWRIKRHILLINAVTLVGFVGADPKQRQAKGNGAKFIVLSVATQRSWKNADEEWSSKTEWHRVVLIWN